MGAAPCSPSSRSAGTEPPAIGMIRPGLPSPPSFQTLYAEQFNFVWRTLRRLGVPPADVPDVAQEVFLVVHRRLPEFEPRARVTTWLFPICLHAARDRRRRAHVRREVSRDASDIVDPAPLPGSDLERQDDLYLFEAALAQMNLDQRAVFVLFELEELRGEDIAATLAIPLGTVYSRLRLARAAFRKGVLERAGAEAGRPNDAEARSARSSGAQEEEP
jgi:RNA polymerase sigma-70 factor (ECF subfamily)